MIKYSLIRKTPLVRILLFFVVGIFFANNSYSLLINKLILILVIAFIQMGFLLFLSLNRRLSAFFDYLLPTTIISIAICLTLFNAKIPTNFENEHIWQGIICEKPLLKNNSILLPIKLSPQQFKSNKLHKAQKLLLYTTKDTNLLNTTNIGDSVFFNAKLNRIKNYGNPDEFDYAKYMLYQGVAFQAYTPSDNIIFLKSEKLKLKRVLSQVQEKALARFKSFVNNEDSFAIVSALTLGYKHYLSDELKQSFINSGAIHVLAVSGLHVGIIYLFLNFLLSFLTNNRKQQLFKICLIIIVIWLYAILTGLSPSITREAIMFSLIGIGKTFRRDISTFNILACTALILLVANPLTLFNIGFQLSFLAVGSIVFFQPRLYNVLNIKNGIVGKIYQLFTVTIAAQLITAPLSMYYFHQFPTYFWLTNILLIPLISISLISAIVLLFTGWVPYFSLLIGHIVELSLIATNKWVSTIEQLPYSVIENIRFPFYNVIIAFLLIVTISDWIIRKKTVYLLAGVLLFVISGSLTLVKEINIKKPNQVIFYNLPRKNFIGVYNNNTNYLLNADQPIKDEKVIKFYFQQHWLKNNYSKPALLSLKSLPDNVKVTDKIYLNRINLPGNECITIYNRNTEHFTNKGISDYIYVCNNVWPPRSLITSSTLILSNTLTPYIKDRWKKYASENNLTAIDLCEKGAYTINY